MSTSLQHPEPGHWLPLMEYATKHDVSLSTLRRYIKSGRIIFRLENGRYLIWESEDGISRPAPGTDSSTHELQAALQKAREEIAELKTLIAFYEEQANPGAN